jgi:hypothetical protein
MRFWTATQFLSDLVHSNFGRPFAWPPLALLRRRKMACENFASWGEADVSRQCSEGRV